MSPVDDYSQRSERNIETTYWRKKLIAYDPNYANDTSYLYGDRAEFEFKRLVNSGAIDTDAILPNRLSESALNTTSVRRHGLNASDYGTPGSGVDNTAALQKLMTDAALVIDTAGAYSNDGTVLPVRRIVTIPAGVWQTNQQLVIPPGVSLELHANAIIRATSVLPGALIATDTSVPWQGQFIRGGTIDCNQMANDGIYIPSSQYSCVEGVIISDCKRLGLQLGEGGYTSFEAKLTNVMIRRHSGLTVPAGSVGIEMRNCSDSMLDKCVVIGYETGFLNKSSDVRFNSCHGWGYYPNLMSTAFDDQGANHNSYSQCVADSPSTAGFKTLNGKAVYSECSVFLSPSQATGVAVGMSIGAGATDLRIIGCRFQAYGGTTFAADFQASSNTWLATSTIVGQKTEYANTTLPATNSFAPYHVVGQLAPFTAFYQGTVAVGDLPIQIFWPVPVEVGEVVIRGYSGAATFQVWQGTTQLTNTFGFDTLTTVPNALNGSTPLQLAKYSGITVKVISSTSGANVTVGFKARQTGV